VSGYLQLHKLGLSRTAIAIYKLLLETGSSEVSNLARQLKVQPQGLYRVVEGLKEQGFIVQIASNPIRLQARPLQVALEHYLSFQHQLVQEIDNTSQHKGRHKTEMNVLIGRDEIFATYLRLAAEAKKELLTISIGEKVPDALYQMVAQATRRGVKSCLIFQKHTTENDLWLKRWIVQGSAVRLLPGEGYHLNIVDDEYAILSASNVKKPEERTAVLVHAPNVVRELRHYFFQQWQLASELKHL